MGKMAKARRLHHPMAVQEDKAAHLLAVPCSRLSI